MHGGVSVTGQARLRYNEAVRRQHRRGVPSVPLEVRDDLPIYTIGRVVALTGLSARQVRYYEKKQLLRPARTPGNQRLYTRDEVHLLQLVRRLLDEGYTLANIQRLVKGHGRPEGGHLEDYPSPEALRREERASLYPLVNRARLLEILDRLERRDAMGQGGARRTTPGSGSSRDGGSRGG